MDAVEITSDIDLKTEPCAGDPSPIARLGMTNGA
jgi:hypothetical protein